jgi:hypothetical protein
MTTTYFAWYYMVDMHLTFICATYLTEATITLKHTLTLLAVASAVQLI